MRVGRPIKENIYLKQKFISYLQGKKLAHSSIQRYVWDVGLFLEWINKSETQVTKPDVLKYLEHLKNQRALQNVSRGIVLNSLNHYFTFLCKNERITQNPCAFLKIRGKEKKQLYNTYTPEELQTLYDNFYHFFVRGYDNSHIPKNQRRQSDLSKQRNAVILNILIHQGATTKEVDTILLQDIDLQKATLKIRGGRKSNERILILEATQIGVLIDYLQNIRPEILEYHTQDNEKLFLTLPEFSKKQTNLTSIMGVFKLLTTQVKSIDKRFVNFQQIRASIITNWIKTQGLRKAQYLAGHRYISTTEKYQCNNLEGLINDIDKLHPF